MKRLACMRRKRIDAWFGACRHQPIQMWSECQKAHYQRNPGRCRGKVSASLSMQDRGENETGDQKHRIVLAKHCKCGRCAGRDGPSKPARLERPQEAIGRER